MVPEQWKDKVKDLRNLSVMKYPKVWQALFYLLKFKSREDICERGTNKLQWKRAKSFLKDDELFKKMSEYWPFGPKEDNFREYEKLAYLKKNLEGISEDQVDDYCVALGKLLKWVNMAIKFRMEDVRQRRKASLALKEERQAALDKEKERSEKKQAALEEAKTAFQEKLEVEIQQKKDEMGEDYEAEEPPEFDMDEFTIKFDDENPETEIPPEVVDDQDNDINIEINLNPPEEEE